MSDKTTVPVFSGVFMKTVSEPLTLCDGRCGIEIVKTVSGETPAVLTDYSPYSNEKPRTVGVMNFFERKGSD